jgi:TRAP transporter TAXI family solute receptor
MTQQRKFALNWQQIAILVAIGLLALAVYLVVSSLPPRSFTILTGREGGGYYMAALEYQRIAKEKGFDLIIQPTSGSVETLRMLEAGEAGIGFVQGGVAVDADPEVLSTMASVFYEPVWIFYNNRVAAGEPLTHLHQLEGLTIAVGEPGSGAELLSKLLLAESDVTSENSTFRPLSSDEAAAALQAGAVDAAIFVTAPTSEIIQTLLHDTDLTLMNVERAAGYASKFTYLTSLVLPEGAIDPRTPIPAEDTHLISTVANLIVRDDFHPDLIRLMTIAAVEVHEKGGTFEQRYEFPNFRHADLPISKEEIAYLERIKSGDSTLDNYLPFWAAALVDRYLLFVLPITLLLLPLITRSPLLLRIYNQRKITRWYAIVRDMDRSVPYMDIPTIERAQKTLDDIEQELQEKVIVPVGYMSAYYDLRSHINLLQDNLQKRHDRLMQEREGGGVAPA